MTWRENIERVREALTPWLRIDGRVDALAALDALTAQIEELGAAVLWIQEFAAKMPRAGVDGGHTGFVHIERRARAALAQSDPPED